MSMFCMCVLRFGVSLTYVIESIDSKLIYVCLINDYSLIADLLIFDYGRAECATISLECTKVKVSSRLKVHCKNSFGINSNFLSL